MTPPPASTVLVRPEAASPLLSTVKPDPDALPTNLTEENRKDTTTPSLPRQKQESEQEQEEEKENNSSIDIADLADTVVNEEMTRYYNTQQQQRICRTGSIQVRRDIVQNAGNRSNSGGASLDSNERGLDLSWSNTRTPIGSPSSPDNRPAATDVKDQQRAMIGRAILHYPGGPPEGRHLFYPATNQSLNQFNGGGSLRGGLSPSDAGAAAHLLAPPPLIR